MSSIFSSTISSSVSSSVSAVYPVVGKFGEKTFRNICAILHEEIASNTKSTTKSTICTSTQLSEIRAKLTDGKLAVIRKKESGKTIVDTSKRVCNRKTFGSEMVEKLRPFIEPTLKTTLVGSLIDPLEILIDPTHCDVLHYGVDGFFDLHRDQIPKVPSILTMSSEDILDGYVWKYYSVIVGLDSKIDKEDDIPGGSTIVFLPSIKEKITSDGEDSEDENSDNGLIISEEMIKHILPQSCERGKFVIFPANALHSSEKIKGKDNFKLSLKLDLWVKQKSLESRVRGITDPTQVQNLCECLICVAEKKYLSEADMSSEYGSAEDESDRTYGLDQDEEYDAETKSTKEELEDWAGKFVQPAEQEIDKDDGDNEDHVKEKEKEEDYDGSSYEEDTDCNGYCEDDLQ